MPNRLLEKPSVISASNCELQNYKSSHEASFSQVSFQVYLVRKEDIYYQKGRVLAQQVYNSVWNTEYLVDNNDYAVVVEYNNRIVGNMNIQLRREDNQIKSEIFFQPEHWQHYFDIPATKTVEISGLAIAEDTPSEIRQSVLMLLLHGGFIMTKSLGIRCWSTIQHKMLYLLITRRLGLPFLANEKIIHPSPNVPNDDYWQGSKRPGIYYLNLDDYQTSHIFNLFFCHLMMDNNVKFLSRFQPNSVHFTSFCKMIAS